MPIGTLFLSFIVFKKLLKKFFIVSLVLLVGLAMLSFTAKAPEGLGVSNGELAQCPDKPNCVSTQTESDEHRMEPVPFQGTAVDTLAVIKNVVGELNTRAKLVDEQTPNYLRYEFRSLIFRFVDDVEFYIDDTQKLIHFRSASRVGHSDLGVNRARMEKISSALVGAVSN